MHSSGDVPVRASDDGDSHRKVEVLTGRIEEEIGSVEEREIGSSHRPRVIVRVGPVIDGDCDRSGGRRKDAPGVGVGLVPA